MVNKHSCSLICYGVLCNILLRSFLQLWRTEVQTQWCRSVACSAEPDPTTHSLPAAANVFFLGELQISQVLLIGNSRREQQYDKQTRYQFMIHGLDNTIYNLQHEKEHTARELAES